jgi:hypothetical protein
MNIDISIEQLNISLLDDNKSIITTITNYGYILYTLNMLKSLKKYNLDKKILIVCIDSKSEFVFKKLGYNVYTFNDNSLQKFVSWNKQGYDKICYIKLIVIYHLLNLNYNALLVDGDIVFLKNPILDIINWSNNNSYDIWIQNDSQNNNIIDNMCTGYMYVKSSNITKKLYDCISNEGIEKYKQCALDNNDQSYFNLFIKPYCNFKPLMLSDYPNGKYYYTNYINENLDNNCILVHFNWVHGHEKLVKIKKHGLWLLTEDEEETLSI